MTEKNTKKGLENIAFHNLDDSMVINSIDNSLNLTWEMLGELFNHYRNENVFSREYIDEYEKKGIRRAEELFVEFFTYLRVYSAVEAVVSTPDLKERLYDKFEKIQPRFKTFKNCRNIEGSPIDCYIRAYSEDRDKL